MTELTKENLELILGILKKQVDQVKVLTERIEDWLGHVAKMLEDDTQKGE